MSLQLGDQLPEFYLNDQEGNPFSSEMAIANGPAVIYFYPKNFTPGCTREACSFRDAFEDFAELGATVIGISADSETSHAKFAKRYRLPFTLLADGKNKVRKLFGVKSNLLGMLPGRETFLFDKDGILIVHVSALGADPHITKTLKKLQNT